MLQLNKKEEGTVLIVSFVFIMMLAALGMTYTMTSVKSAELVQDNYKANRALSIAEAAVEQALWDLNYNKNTDGSSKYPLSATNSVIDWKCATTNSTIIENPRGGSYSITAEYNENGGIPQSALTVWAQYGNLTKNLRMMLVLDTSTNTTTTLVHNLYYKAIYAGNKSGGPYTFELTGKDTNADRVNGDIHIEGDIITSLNGHSTINSGNDQTNATGTVQQVDALGNPITDIANAEPASDSLTPPLLDLALYTAASRQYKSWDSTSQGSGHDVVQVHTEYEHYQAENQLQTIAISQESSTKIAGTTVPEWNTTAKALPDTSAANFFQEGYQNHFAKPFSYADDQKVAATKNYYIGSRNNGTSNSSGNNNTTNGTGYGGGHSVIPISKAQNNKIYYVEGNVWLDSDGSNHIFFVPGPDLGNEPIRITIVAKGNIYIGDQIFVFGDNESKTKANEGISNLNGTWGDAISQLNPNSAIALIAMGDGESYDDVNKNGKYDAGEQILGRPQDPNNPSQTIPKPATTNPMDATSDPNAYRGRLEGSGNIIFGDTIQGPVGSVEAFLYADNNFDDISTNNANSQQTFVLGNMSAGNHVNLDRNQTGWEFSGEKTTTIPAGWHPLSDGRYYPPNVTEADRTNPLVATRYIEPTITWGFVSQSNSKPAGYPVTLSDGYSYPSGTTEANKYNAASRVIKQGGKWKKYTPTKTANSYDIYSRVHTPLDVKLDQRIRVFSEDPANAGNSFLPGLPASTTLLTNTTIAYGNWKPIMWLAK